MFCASCARRGRAFLGLAALALFAPAASGQFIIDRRPDVRIWRSFEVREFRVDARVRDQAAEVQVSQTFHNPGSAVQEVEYLFPVPESGAIQNFMLMVDGKELPGKLLPKDEARRTYENIVRSKKDPALLEYAGSGLYKTSVFPIPPGTERKVTLRFTQLLSKKDGIVELAYPFGTQKFTSQPIRTLALDISIESSEAIKSIYSPSHDVSIERRGERSARIKLIQESVVPDKDFRLAYTVADGDLGASVLSRRTSGEDDGFFLLLASPKVEAPEAKPQPKTVIFVVDRSGSMAGSKIEQARSALKFVIDNLKPDDLFNIIAYDDRIEMFKPELQRFTPESRAAAITYAEDLRPGGGTNIDEGLKSALAQIQDDSRPNYILFLTDGLPTVGQTNELQITADAKSANKHRARVFCFGVGYDVNSRLLERLSMGNAGTSTYVKPDDNIEGAVGAFYSKLTVPVLTNIKVELTGTSLNRTYPRDIPDLFQGSQLVISGRYTESGKSTLVLTGKVGEESIRYEFPVNLAAPGEGSDRDYIETLWASRRIVDLLDQIDLNGRNQELIKELVGLSTKYGILTPYTSYLADENTPIQLGTEHFRRAEAQLKSLDSVSGQDAFAARESRSKARAAQRSSSAGYAGLAEGMTPGGYGRLGGGMAGMGGMGDGRMGRGMAGMGGGMGGMGNMGQAATERARQPVDAAKAGAADYAQRANRGGNDRVATRLAREAEVPPVAASPSQPMADPVKRIGGKTFFFKEGRWIDSEIQKKTKAKEVAIVQFSDAYFDLARKAKADWSPFLAFEEPITVLLDGTIYKIDPEPKK